MKMILLLSGAVKGLWTMGPSDKNDWHGSGIGFKTMDRDKKDTLTSASFSLFTARI